MRLAATIVLVCLAGAAGAGPLRDPFLRPGSSGAAPVAGATAPAPETRQAPPAPRLRAILYARGQALADVDGLVLREGDEVRGWRVVGIEERRVRLQRGATGLVLEIGRESPR